jgi:hypothetical protein
LESEIIESTFSLVIEKTVGVVKSQFLMSFHNGCTDYCGVDYADRFYVDYYYFG